MRWLHAIYLGLSNQRSRNEASQLSEQRGFVKMVPEGLGQGVRFLCIGGDEGGAFGRASAPPPPVFWTLSRTHAPQRPPRSLPPLPHTPFLHAHTTGSSHDVTSYAAQRPRGPIPAPETHLEKHRAHKTLPPSLPSESVRLSACAVPPQPQPWERRRQIASHSRKERGREGFVAKGECMCVGVRSVALILTRSRWEREGGREGGRGGGDSITCYHKKRRSLNAAAGG